MVYELKLAGKIAVFFALWIPFAAALLHTFRKTDWVRPLFWVSGVLFVFFFATRAYHKSFFPFTDKVESFTTFSALMLVLGYLYLQKLGRKEFFIFVLLASLFGTVCFVFDDPLKYPTPYLLTIWYPLHVPLSFLAYAFWFVAGVASFSVLIFKKDPTLAGHDKSFLVRSNRHGFNAFTFSMIFGGIWGYLAWGAYFLWDPKLLWSVILWLYYGNLLHIDNLPRLRKWREPLYLVGIVLILITFIGTGFFTRSIHKF